MSMVGSNYLNSDIAFCSFVPFLYKMLRVFPRCIAIPSSSQAFSAMAQSLRISYQSYHHIVIDTHGKMCLTKYRPVNVIGLTPLQHLIFYSVHSCMSFHNFSHSNETTYRFTYKYNNNKI